MPMAPSWTVRLCRAGRTAKGCPLSGVRPGSGGQLELGRSTPTTRRGTKRRRTARTTSSYLDELSDLRGDSPRAMTTPAMVESGQGQGAMVGLRQDPGDGEGGALERGTDDGQVTISQL